MQHTPRITNSDKPVSLAQINRLLNMASIGNPEFSSLTRELVGLLKEACPRLGDPEKLVSKQLERAINGSDEQTIFPKTWQEMRIRKSDAVTSFSGAVIAVGAKPEYLNDTVSLFAGIWDKIATSAMRILKRSDGIYVNDYLAMAHYDPEPLLRKVLTPLWGGVTNENQLRELKYFFDSSLATVMKGFNESLPETWHEFDRRASETMTRLEKLLETCRIANVFERLEMLAYENHTIISLIADSFTQMKQEVQQFRAAGSYLQ